METVRVWDPLVRVFHWGLATAIVTAWLTADDLQNLHEFAGYVAGGLIALRLVLGLGGSRYARFTQFIRSPRRTWHYARDMLKHREARYLGHNPLGAAMVVLLILLTAAVAFTGWLQTTDAYWGVEWVEETHEALANIFLVAVPLHVLGVIHASRRHRENLVAAMITGRKRAASGSDLA
ncbi:cytochrome b/b6 domain-containing protein [Allorhizobium pseudoryzae]|uniref:cytochrome b/b6 domain-containing protein n=1 Tax=Allorhizobium pseudoryzae TaxID=379684 RepID=UPI003D00AC80